MLAHQPQFRAPKNVFKRRVSLEENPSDFVQKPSDELCATNPSEFGQKPEPYPSNIIQSPNNNCTNHTATIPSESHPNPTVMPSRVNPHEEYAESVADSYDSSDHCPSEFAAFDEHFQNLGSLVDEDKHKRVDPKWIPCPSQEYCLKNAPYLVLWYVSDIFKRPSSMRTLLEYENMVWGPGGPYLEEYCGFEEDDEPMNLKSVVWVARVLDACVQKLAHGKNISNEWFAKKLCTIIGYTALHCHMTQLQLVYARNIIRKFTHIFENEEPQFVQNCKDTWFFLANERTPTPEEEFPFEELPTTTPEGHGTLEQLLKFAVAQWRLKGYLMPEDFTELGADIANVLCPISRVVVNEIQALGDYLLSDEISSEELDRSPQWFNSEPNPRLLQELEYAGFHGFKRAHPHPDPVVIAARLRMLCEGVDGDVIPAHMQQILIYALNVDGTVPGSNVSASTVTIHASHLLLSLNPDRFSIFHTIGSIAKRILDYHQQLQPYHLAASLPFGDGPRRLVSPSEKIPLKVRTSQMTRKTIERDGMIGILCDNLDIFSQEELDDLKDIRLEHQWAYSRIIEHLA
ncbi:hypothetical protein HK104_010254 [Borealophlyctis nickersoniae]|nr:hypothetical protein HK104_010254 [Borealophlyctis nickersoniae]